MSSTFAAGTFALYWTGIAYFCFGFIDEDLLGGSSRYDGKYLSLRTDLVILLRVILKEFGGVISRALTKICGRKIGLDPALFQTNNIAITRLLNLPMEDSPLVMQHSFKR